MLVGCNYASTPSATLQGCINDASCLRYLLFSRFGFRDEDVVLLLDMSPYPSQWPTRSNILWHASALSSNARAGDSLFFSFSGHGAQVPDQSGDEADGLSETICPCDFQGSGSGGGMILDDELNLALVRPLPTGAKLHCLLDCCHSGSALNLEFRCKARDGPVYWKQEYEYQPRTYKGTAGGLVVGISASRDKQVAADTSQLAAGGSHTGAATFTFIQSIEAYGTSLSYEALLRNVSGGASLSFFSIQLFFDLFSAPPPLTLLLSFLSLSLSRARARFFPLSQINQQIENKQMKTVLDDSVNNGPSSGLAGLGLPVSLGGGGGGGTAGGIMGKLNSLLSGALDAAGMSGQTPCLTSNFAFDLNTPLGV